ncbi:hypothetical protein FA95DRAFT_912262 [Auriscalpium vulgare]|uniref:Uncharacterized protein n=1 Tax=Auriscalpium vulgare TaxID=40419 RepID=A0ACB8R7Q6_9AGAM|nr:hypothetical protein FA95DRAFT_912262 [Auriscalpium vulgare]
MQEDGGCRSSGGTGAGFRFKWKRALGLLPKIAISASSRLCVPTLCQYGCLPVQVEITRLHADAITPGSWQNPSSASFELKPCLCNKSKVRTYDIALVLCADVVKIVPVKVKTELRTER